MTMKQSKRIRNVMRPSLQVPPPLRAIRPPILPTIRTLPFPKALLALLALAFGLLPNLNPFPSAPRALVRLQILRQGRSPNMPPTIPMASRHLIRT